MDDAVIVIYVQKTKSTVNRAPVPARQVHRDKKKNEENKKTKHKMHKT